MASVRNIHPDVGKANSRLCNAYKSKLGDEVIAECRRQLHEAKIRAKAEKLAEELFALPPENPVRDQVRAIFAGGA
jgi:hypothetical protein